MTKIIKCDCTSAFQDSRYGKGQRLHNVCGGKKSVQFRCTVCTAMKDNHPTKAGTVAVA